jgi:hypothetical protein
MLHHVTSIHYNKVYFNVLFVVMNRYFVSNCHKSCFYIEPTGNGQGLLGHSVLVVLKTLNKVVDRMECYAGQIYYLLWSPDGKQIGELPVFIECIMVLSDIAMGSKYSIRLHSKETHEVCCVWS